ncbi:GTPase IMAP family member 8-like protein [Perkinsela sp. CCAP 1560/4]|nr:GTPase IMAP family member 8-like protein [Perkinsela sp. CCAP 1560/4]|eukprot:KNH06225.1 GTPase IMAP family member 8-like protein [Perkinsela sp. CCAP 1560/4]
MPRNEPREVRLVRLHCRQIGIGGGVAYKRRGRDALLVIASTGAPLRVDCTQRCAERVADPIAGLAHPFHVISSPEPADRTSDDGEDTLGNGGLEAYIQDLKMGTLRIHECLKEDDEIRQRAESQLQRNVRETQKGAADLSTLTDSHAFFSRQRLSQLWHRPASFSAGQVILLPLRLFIVTLRAILNVLLFPALFLLTVGVIFSIPKK